MTLPKHMMWLPFNMESKQLSDLRNFQSVYVIKHHFHVCVINHTKPTCLMLFQQVSTMSTRQAWLCWGTYLSTKGHVDGGRLMHKSSDGYQWFDWTCIKSILFNSFSIFDSEQIPKEFGTYYYCKQKFGKLDAMSKSH